MRPALNQFCLATAPHPVAECCKTVLYYLVAVPLGLLGWPVFFLLVGLGMWAESKAWAPETGFYLKLGGLGAALEVVFVLASLDSASPVWLIMLALSYGLLTYTLRH